ncbi:MAG TPA: methyltransferase domain-containing protein [Gemmatimonadota bacterium]|nr:methyltransferase domain-containing protein [Gemmatimonadota bacterium]
MLRALPLIAAAVLLGACDNADAPIEDAPDTASVASDPAGHDEVEEIPSREAELTRDVGSKPQELMDFLGIDRGDRVADIFAGAGYYTYLLSERVGSTGMVWAQGFSPGLAARADSGDLADATNVTLVDSLSELPEATLDAAIIIRGFHLYPDAAELLRELNRALKAGGIVGVEEVRLGREYGHDMETHRMGERTVIEEFEKHGFDYVGSSDILYNPDDPHTEFMEGERHLADRMLLKFTKPGEPASSEPSTAARSR